ncbi:MAG: MATE family efflux transporter [Oscillospiraceae bacterium]|nr:MATE family efflux transporter [Oscillospiraceae bacterium]
MNKRRQNIDFTTGNITRNLILFAIPMLIGAVFQLLYNMVDSAVLGRFVSIQALAAVGATSATGMLVMQFTNAVTNAMSVQVSQAWGAKKEDRMRRLLAHCMGLSLAVGLFIMIVMFNGSYAIMKLLGTPAEIIDDAALYLRITCGFYIGHLYYNTATSVLRAIGDSRAPLYFLIFSSLVNIVLDLLFVVAFHMEVLGVALATVISQFLSAALCLTYLFRKYPMLRFGRSDMKPDGAILRDYARIAVPMAFQGVMLSVGDMIMTRVLNSFGTETVAAFTIGSKCQQIVQLAFSQVAFSMSVYTGQNYGAKQYQRIRTGMRKALLLMAGLVAFSMAVMFLFGDKLMLIYMDPATAGDVVPVLVKQYITVIACFLPIHCMIWSFNSALRGMGHVTPTVISSFVELACKIGFSLLLAPFFGAMGLWFVLPLGWVFGLMPSLGFYFFGKWEEKALAKDAAAS